MNPKTSIFTVSEGNLLRHIVSKIEIKVDRDRVQATTHIPYPVNKKAMQSFLGNINFLQKFISDYAQIVKPIQDMIKKDVVYSGGKREKYTFTWIKQAITEAPTLYIVDFKKDFLLHTFAFHNLLVKYSLRRMR